MSSPTNSVSFNCDVCQTKVWFTPHNNKNIPPLGVFTCSQKCHKAFLKTLKTLDAAYKAPPSSPVHKAQKIEHKNNKNG